MDARIRMCHCLEKVKKILSASSFNLYYRFYHFDFSFLLGTCPGWLDRVGIGRLAHI
jgi:hypothetical protein